MTSVPLAMAALGGLLALLSLFAGRRWATAAVGFGWIALVVDAALLQFGGRVGMAVDPIPTAIAMAGTGALVVIPATTERTTVRRVGAFVGALTAFGAVGAGQWFGSEFGAAPWPSGALLLGAHWTSLGASAAAATIGGLLGLGWVGLARREDPDSDRVGIVRAHARDSAGRAVVLAWLAWAIAELVHWRFLGTPAVASRSEWFGLGMTLLATGGLLVGWTLGDDTLERIRSAVATVWVAVVLIAGIWLSFGFGSPFQLTVGP